MNIDFMQENMRLVHSLLTYDGPAGTIDDIRQWLKKRNEAVQVDIELTDFSDLKGWRFNETTGDLEHESGKFFAIRGLDVETEGFVRTNHWNQPIIDQPEIGFLGIIAQEHDGVLCFLLQAKIEPGNLNHVQLSPTLQATRSNYMQVHKGKVPRYLEYFKNARDHKIWLDQLQSEQGGRFFHKRNRNIIIEVKESIPEHEDFIWVTLGQLKKLMHFDNLVNMDTRTVISGLGWRGNDIVPLLQYSDSERSRALLSSLYSSDIDTCNIDNLFWLSELKTKYSLRSSLMPLKDLDHWAVHSNEIARDDRLFFRVVGANITISNREVATWCQPLVQPMQEGICALIMKIINGTMYFLIQAKMECGTLDVVEMAPTLQCLTGNYKQGHPMFLEYILNASPEQIVYDCYQSEEGGRFFREQNRNMLIVADQVFPEDNLPENFRWMSLVQMREFLKYNNYLNIQLRSLLAAIDIFADCNNKQVISK